MHRLNWPPLAGAPVAFGERCRLALPRFSLQPLSVLLPHTRVPVDVPLGFGVTAKSTTECRTADPNAIVVFHQADCGEYLRAEDEL